VQLSGASVDHVRLLPVGWRGELRLESGATLSVGSGVPTSLRQALEATGACAPRSAELAVAAAPCARAATPARAGLYVLSYDGDYLLRPVRPADLRLLSLQAGSTTTPPSSSAVPLTIEASNEGEADADPRLIEIWAEQGPSAQPINVANLSVALPAGERQTLTADWLPPAAGAWTLWARLAASGGGQAAATDTVQTHVVVPSARPEPWWSLGPVPDRVMSWLAVGCLLGFALAAGAYAWALLR
jgi:hypothetical protein